MKYAFKTSFQFVLHLVVKLILTLLKTSMLVVLLEPLKQMITTNGNNGDISWQNKAESPRKKAGK